MYIDNLFYKYSDIEKLNVNKTCNVKKLEIKKGEFFLNLIEDLSRRFGVKNILLQDESTIKYGKYKIKLPIFYLQKNGITYYEKYGFKAVKSKEINGNIFKDLTYNFKLLSGISDLKFIKNELKKIPILNEKNIIEWISKTSSLQKHLPVYYLKKI